MAGMSFDPTLLFLSLIPSAVGFGLFMYGKKNARFPQLIAGILLMASPYFASTAMSLLATDAVIGAAFWYALHIGW